MSKRFLAAAASAAGLMLSPEALAFAQVAASPPVIDDIIIVSDPLTNRDAFGPGEEIRVDVVFSEPVTVTGNPLLDLRIGDQTRRADLYNVDDTTLSFRYFVKAADRDDDGIGVPADAVQAAGGSIRDAAGNDADLTHEAVPDDARFKVDGRPDAAPTITDVALGRTAAEETVVRGAPLIVSVWFSERIEVTGAPQFSIQVGTQTRQAELHRRGGATELEFQYFVQASDVDADGVSIPADALTLNGGSITDADGNDADLTHDAVPDIPHFKVNGAVGVPFVTRVGFLREPAATGTYVAGETIFTRVWFSRPVRVTGAPQFTVQVGTQARRADHLPALRAAELLPPGNRFHEPGDGSVVFFQYVVQPSDVDDDGISAPASALTLNGGSIRAVGDNTDARLGHVAVADDPARKVDGRRGDDQARPRVTSAYVLDLPIQGVFGGGDTITAVLSLSEGVTLTGAPRFGLRIGGRTRFATFRERWGSTSLLFDYVVEESDRDDDGLSIAADAVDLNGATIRDNAGNDANLDLGYRAFDDDPRYRVDGRLTAVPALPLGGALALLLALLAGGWRRLVRAGVSSAG